MTSLGDYLEGGWWEGERKEEESKMILGLEKPGDLLNREALHMLALSFASETLGIWI